MNNLHWASWHGCCGSDSMQPNQPSQPSAHAQPDAAAPKQLAGDAIRRAPSAEPQAVLAWADTRNGYFTSTTRCRTRSQSSSGLASNPGPTTPSSAPTRHHRGSPRRPTATPASGGPNLSNVDAIFFMGHREVPLDENAESGTAAVRQRRPRLRRRHVGLTAFESWPEFGDLLGGRNSKASDCRRRDG